MKLKRKIWSLVIFVGIVLLVGFLYRMKVTHTISHMFDDEDPFSQDKRLLVDSLRYNDTLILYQFTFDSGTFGHSSDYLSVTTNRNLVSEDNAFFYSNSISSINKLGNDSLLIKLIELDFHVDSTKVSIPFKIELENQGEYIHPSKRLNIPIK
jgi:hypothetical protein